MPRKHKRIPGSRRYADYTAEKLEACLGAVRSGELSQREAEAKFKIPRSTIKNKLKNKHVKHIGRPTIFTEAEEECFTMHMIKLCDYHFPVTETDFRFFVQSYLDKKGMTVSRFVNNLPGPDFVKGFLKRNPILSIRFSNNAKNVRAEITEEMLTFYHANLSEELKGIPPERIWNYDETNLSDDPGRKRVIARRGSKYIENKCNHSKSSTSVMFCGNAAGRLLPPYVVYRGKGDGLWDTWREGGPAGTTYNKSKSGWFDFYTFEHW